MNVEKVFQKTQKREVFPYICFFGLTLFLSFWEDVVNKTWKLSFPQWAKNSAINIGFSICARTPMFLKINIFTPLKTSSEMLRLKNINKLL